MDIIQLDLCLYTLQNHNLGRGGGPLHPAGGFHAVGKLTEVVEQNMDYQLQYRMNDSLKKMDDLANLIQHKQNLNVKGSLVSNYLHCLAPNINLVFKIFNRSNQKPHFNRVPEDRGERGLQHFWD